MVWMKITKLTTFMVPPRWLFLKMETDEGIVGWGEPVLEGRAATVATAVEELSDYLIGQDSRHRGSVDCHVPRRLLPRRRNHDECRGRYRPGRDAW
jgi:L-alanine-DL-glutamate epimerase-like enolase superfamily enzyme